MRRNWFPFDLGCCIDLVKLRTFTAVLNSRAIITSRRVCLFDESSNGSRSCFVNRSPHQFVLVDSCPARSLDRKNCDVRVLLQVPFFWRIPDVVEDITFLWRNFIVLNLVSKLFWFLEFLEPF